MREVFSKSQEVRKFFLYSALVETPATLAGRPGGDRADSACIAGTPSQVLGCDPAILVDRIGRRRLHGVLLHLCARVIVTFVRAERPTRVSVVMREERS